MLARLTAKAVVADKGYDTDAIRGLLAQKDMQVVIPTESNRRKQIPHDRELYKERNRIERCFGWLKRHRRIATRSNRS